MYSTETAFLKELNDVVSAAVSVLDQEGSVILDLSAALIMHFCSDVYVKCMEYACLDWLLFWQQRVNINSFRSIDTKVQLPIFYFYILTAYHMAYRPNLMHFIDKLTTN